MQSTEIICEVRKGYSSIINQVNSKLTIDTEIMDTSKHIDSLLEKLMTDIEQND